MTTEQKFAYMTAIVWTCADKEVIRDAVNACQAMENGDGETAFELSGRVAEATGWDLALFI